MLAQIVAGASQLCALAQFIYRSPSVLRMLTLLQEVLPFVT